MTIATVSVDWTEFSSNPAVPPPAITGLSVRTSDGVPVMDQGSPTNSPTCPLCSIGMPVVVGTGTLWDSTTDFLVPGRTKATSLAMTRTYLAQPLITGGDFGPHWFHPYETRLLSLSDSSSSGLIWIDPSGGSWSFQRNQDGSFQSPPSFFGTLVELSDHYELRETHGITLSFSKDPTLAPVGRLLSLSEPHGKSISLTYTNGLLSSFSTGLAGSVSIERDAQNRIIRLTRVRGSLSYIYAYGPDGELSSFSDGFDAVQTLYAYQSTPENPATDYCAYIHGSSLRAESTGFHSTTICELD